MTKENLISFENLLQKYGSALRIPYFELLNTKEWWGKRLAIIERDLKCCKKCGKTETTWFNGKHCNVTQYKNEEGKDSHKIEVAVKNIHLHVHHKYYVLNKLPWNYADNALITLCNWCHWEFHKNHSVPIYESDKMIVDLKYKPCLRCFGAGWFPEFTHVYEGKCFRCHALKYDELLAEYYFNKGQAEMIDKNHSGAGAFFEHAKILNPQISKYYSRSGISNLYSKEFVKAIDDFSNAIELKPFLSFNYSLRGVAQNNLNNFAQAINDFNEAIRLSNPEDTKFKNILYDSYVGRGKANVHLTKNVDAINDFTKAILLKKSSAPFKFRGAARYNIKKYHDAIADWMEAISLNDSDRKNCYYYMGLAKIELGDKIGARFDLKKAKELGHPNAEKTLEKLK